MATVPTPIHLAKLIELYETPTHKASAARAAIKRAEGATRHLWRLLRRSPTVADLTDANVAAVFDRIIRSGRSEQTADRVAWTLISISRLAEQRGLGAAAITFRPKRERKRTRRHHLTVREIRQVLAACLNIRAPVAGLNGGAWWLTVLLCVLNTGQSIEALLQLPDNAWDRAGQLLRVKGLCYRVHSVTAEALAWLKSSTPSVMTDRLLPWTLDRGKPPFGSFYNHFVNIAAESKVRRNDLTPKLLSQAAAHVGASTVLDAIDIEQLRLMAVKQEIDGRTAGQHADRTQSREAGGRAKKIDFSNALDSRALRRFLEEQYCPARLPELRYASVWKHRRAVRALCDSLDREATLDDLTEPNIENAMAKLLSEGGSAVSANHIGACLAAQWTFAYKRRLVNEPFRAIHEYRVPKRVPIAWKAEEVEQLLAAASRSTGVIGDVPMRLYWPGLILLIYETGLRIGAVMELLATDLDASTGWLSVPASIQKQNADQSFQLTPATLQTVLATRPETRPHLMRLKRWFRSELFETYTQLLQQAGLPHEKTDKFHKLRRTSASYWARKLGRQEASRHLGHSSVTVTDAYLDPQISTPPQPADVLPRLVWGRTETE